MYYIKKIRLYILFICLSGIGIFTFSSVFADTIIPGGIDSSLQVIQRLLITLDGSPIGSPIADLNSGGNIIFYAPIKDGAGNRYITGEADPLFSSSAAAGISASQISHWNTAYGRGNPALMGYLTGESDPFWFLDKPNYYTKTEVDNLLSSSVGGLKYKGVWDYSTGALPSDVSLGSFFKISVEGDFHGLHLSVGDMIIANSSVSGDSSPANWDIINNTVSETDPVFAASIAAAISATQVSQWNDAYSRGNHALMGYLTGESDPLWSLEKIYYYTKAQIDAKNYLTTETDPIWNADKNDYYTKAQINSKGYLTSFTETDPEWTASKTNYYTKSDIDTKFDALSGLNTSAGITGEIDPVFSAHPAANVTNNRISNWDAAYSRGNHAIMGYLTGESDPIWNSEKANYYSKAAIDNKGFLTGFSESDPVFLAHPAANITNNKISNWDAAYSRGNHAIMGYLTGEADPVWNSEKANYYSKAAIDAKGFLTSFSESDPIWNSEKSNYYSKSAIDSKGFLTSFTELDPLFSASVAAQIGFSDISDWNSASNWITTNSGNALYFFNNSGNYYTKSAIDNKGFLTGFTESDPIWNSEKTNYYTKTAIDSKGFLTGFTESDPVFSAHPAANVTTNRISNWDAAYSRGNHAIMGYLTGESDPIWNSEKTNYYSKSAIDSKGFLTGFTESDPIWNTEKTNYYTKSAIDSKGFLTSFTELDPLFSASVAAQIGFSDISDWSSASNWITANSGNALYFFNNSGNYYTKSAIDSKGFLTSFTESDPIWNATSGNYYSKSAIDAKGFLTGQFWSNSGVDLNYMNGDVGIGNNNPIYPLDLNGSGSLIRLSNPITGSNTTILFETINTGGGSPYFTGQYTVGSEQAGTYPSRLSRLVIAPTNNQQVPIFSIRQFDGNTAKGAFFEFWGIGGPNTTNGESLRFYIGNPFGTKGTMDAVLDTQAVGTGTSRNLQLKPGGIVSLFLGTNGNNGIGTISSTSKWGVLGNLAVGTTYGNLAAPVGGAIIEGNLGVGTSTPTALFHVAQPTAGVGTVTVATGATTIAGVGTQFTNTFATGDSITIGGQTRTISAISSDTALSVSGAITSGFTATGFTLVGGDRFIVKGNGNVGIGTTNPLYKLDVRGSANFTGTVNVATPTTGTNATTKSYVDSALSNKASFYMMNGTLARDYNTQITNGNGIYISDVLGAISNGPSFADPPRFSMSIVSTQNSINGSYSSQLSISDYGVWFRGGTTANAQLLSSWRGLLAVSLPTSTNRIPFIIDDKANVGTTSAFAFNTGNNGLGLGLSGLAQQRLEMSGGNMNMIGSGYSYMLNNYSAVRSYLNKLQIGFSTGFTSLGLFTNGLERVSIDTNGNVGIGVIAPRSKLEVVGDIELPSTGGVLLGSPNTEGTRRITTSGTNLSFQVYHGSAWVEKSTIAP